MGWIDSYLVIVFVHLFVLNFRLICFLYFCLVIFHFILELLFVYFFVLFRVCVAYCWLLLKYFGHSLAHIYIGSSFLLLFLSVGIELGSWLGSWLGLGSG